MRDRKARPLQEELIACISMLVCGASMHRYFVPGTVIIVLGFILCIWMFILDVTKGSPKELDREARDERSLMIRDQAAWFCRKVENVLWIVGWIALSVYTEQNVISYVMYWIIILRYWLFFAARWWLDRKY